MNIGNVNRTVIKMSKHTNAAVTHQKSIVKGNSKFYFEIRFQWVHIGLDDWGRPVHISLVQKQGLYFQNTGLQKKQNIEDTMHFRIHWPMILVYAACIARKFCFFRFSRKAKNTKSEEFFHK